MDMSPIRKFGENHMDMSLIRKFGEDHMDMSNFNVPPEFQRKNYYTPLFILGYYLVF